jgi:hypothetical protein
MEAEHLEKRFGLIAVEKGLITKDQLIEALKIQVYEDIDKGKHRLIGRILLEQGLITVTQIDEILEEMGRGLPLLKER